MKLIFAIVHNEDKRCIIDSLTEKGFSVTKLCSTGGFLKSGNTTLLMGVEEEKVNTVMQIIKENSKCRKEGVKASPSAKEKSSIPVPNPVEVVVGRATVFVSDVERFEKA